ncbi:hypothetical protein [Sphingomonas profundi]|uniref:hypothetical protein n=1 Tax=Alterirhizorhabdus profundi TaxID=2681549 RepID=UPI001E41AA93|nr:hypothetical protein [Sphingomonas profundi]
MRTYRSAGVLMALAIASPAMAGPNAFWMFGLDRQYNHGTGGRADATDAMARARVKQPAILLAAATHAKPQVVASPDPLPATADILADPS